MSRGLSERLDALEQQRGTRADIEVEYQAYIKEGVAKLYAELDKTSERMLAAEKLGMPMLSEAEAEAEWRRRMTPEVVARFRAELKEGAARQREWFFNRRKR